MWRWNTAAMAEVRAPYVFLAGCDTAPKAPEVAVKEAWVRLPAVVGRPGAAYFTLEGNVTPMKLVSVTSPDLDIATAGTVAAIHSALADVPVLVGGWAISGRDHATALGADGWAGDETSVERLSVQPVGDRGDVEAGDVDRGQCRAHPLPRGGQHERGRLQDAMRTVEAEGLPWPAELVGHSLGGRVSLAVALVATAVSLVVGARTEPNTRSYANRADAAPASPTHR